MPRDVASLATEATINRRLAVAGDVVDEGLVDLDAVDGELLQVGQGGIAGAEIVQRHPHARGAHDLQIIFGAFNIVDDGGLGQLDLDLLWGHIGFGGIAQDAFADVVPQKLAGGEVDRHIRAAPAAAVAQGLAGDPVADLQNQSGLFRDGDELSRRDGAVVGAVPADQRPKAQDGGGLGLDDGADRPSSTDPSEGRAPGPFSIERRYLVTSSNAISNARQRLRPSRLAA